MSPGRRAKIRAYTKILFEQQNGKCFYCTLEMIEWSESWRKFTQRVRISAIGTRRSRKHRLPTFEHLVRRTDGGPDTLENGAAAHQFCNSSRRGRTVEQHREAMLALARSGKHPCCNGLPLTPLPARVEIDTSDIPEAGEEFFEKARLAMPGESAKPMGGDQ